MVQVGGPRAERLAEGRGIRGLALVPHLLYVKTGNVDLGLRVGPWLKHSSPYQYYLFYTFLM